MQQQLEIPNNVNDLLAAMNLTADFDAEVEQHGLTEALTTAMDSVVRASDILADEVRANGFKDDLDEDRKTRQMVQCQKTFVMLARARKAAREFDAISSSTGMVIH